MHLLSALTWNQFRDTTPAMHLLWLIDRSFFFHKLHARQYYAPGPIHTESYTWGPSLSTMDPIPARITYRSRLQSPDKATHCFYTLCTHSSFVYSGAHPLPSSSCCACRKRVVFCTPPSKLMVLDQNLFFNQFIILFPFDQPLTTSNHPGRSVSVGLSLGLQQPTGGAIVSLLAPWEGWHFFYQLS